MSTATESTAAAGLRGVVAAQSSIGDVDGVNGVLIYQGYDIHDLAENSTFEEVVFLLWNGRLPKGSELEALRSQFRANYNVPSAVIDMMKTFPKESDPMDVLRTSVSSLDFYDKDGHGTDRERATRAAIRITGQIGTIAAAWDRIRRDLEVVEPDTSLGIAENFLYMLRGERADAEEARMFDVALILHADHELNASTFTTRVVSGTLAGMYGAVTAGIAALAGPLHGGANTNVMKMLIEIGELDKVEAWIEKALEEKRKIMGIGHAVYKTEDPRATWLRKYSKQMADKTGVSKWFEMSQLIEKLMHEKKGMFPNVDFYSASTYYLMGIPLDLFTPIFAVSRISGWTGHILEQYADNKLIRPRAEYVGPRGLKYVPIAER
ncbi:MAG: citrate synthase [Blastocatellia bacterium]|nr:citrate synthase [Chloracidobacterium sp.]MBL8185718.1 citrate synthase [Blastocatellia bacterium]HRJ88473.1 citrate synthase [Pyrinomonadaceae bacterium]HRK50586.1 citrate synthase [Pyrinomonadaceae bacterium]